MAKKSVQEYLSKIKIPNQFRQYKRIKTPSYRTNGKEGGDAVTLSAVDQFLFENFRSLYQEEYEQQISTTNAAEKSVPPSTPIDSPRLLGSPPRENLCASSRFFVSSGSWSSRIVDEAACSSSATNDSSPSPTAEVGDFEEIAEVRDDYVAILMDSERPYDDFRRSMQEMLEARSARDGGVDWEFLEELLFGYLKLNDKKSYRFILRAFVDMIVDLRENSGAGLCSRPQGSEEGFINKQL